MKREKLTFFTVRDVLFEKGIVFFTPREFRLLFGTSPPQTKYFLTTHVQNGAFVRLKPGLYMFADQKPAAEEIANAIYRPSYLSLEYALSYHGIIPETVYTMTSVTTKPTREFEVRGIAYDFHAIKKEAYTGYSLTGGGRRFFLAEPEKALVDYLYFVSLGKKTLNDRLSVRRVEKQKALSYAKLFGRENLLLLVEEAWKTALAEKEIF